MKFRILQLTVLACTYFFSVPSFAQDNWTNVAPLPQSRWLLAAAKAGDGQIYAIAGNEGGPDFYGTTETVLAYDPNADAWQQVASLSAPRQNLAAATDLSGRIYAIGGYLHGYPFFRSTVERYDPQVGYWTRRADMPTARPGLAAATDSNGLIYALGGSLNFSAPTSLVEVYDSGADTWFTGTAMISPREGFAAATGLDGRIYALGGFDGNAYLGSAEVYDPVADTWTAIAPMQSIRYGLAAATGPDGRIYAIGGYAGSDLSSVEAYDPATDTWTYVASMSVPREGLAVAAAPDGRIFAIAGPGTTVEAYKLVVPEESTSSRSRLNRPIVASFANAQLDSALFGCNQHCLDPLGRDLCRCYATEIDLVLLAQLNRENPVSSNRNSSPDTVPAPARPWPSAEVWALADQLAGTGPVLLRWPSASPQ